MIYIDNTTEDQVILIGRNIKSIENINPITLNSNYYTKVEVDVIAQRTLEQSKEYTNNLANEYYDIAEEYIDSNIERLENRIDELENNGGSSNPPIIIDLGIAVEPNLVLSKEEMIMIADNYMLRDIIIKCKTSSTINDERYFKVLHVEDMRKGGYDRIVVYVGVFFNDSIAYYWDIDTERDTYVSMKTYGFAKYTSDFEQIKTNTTAIEALDSRVTDLENNGGGTTNLQEQITANTTRINNVEQVIVLDVTGGMSITQFNTIYNDFQSRNYKYLLNVGNNDYFNICSIQTANRSITAIGFDDYEGEMMCYNWYQPNPVATPELTKRKIITEIV